MPFPPGPGTGWLGASPSGAAARGQVMEAGGLHLAVDCGYRVRWPRAESLGLGRGLWDKPPPAGSPRAWALNSGEVSLSFRDWGGGQVLRLPGGGEEGGAQRGVSPEGAQRARCGPLGSGFSCSGSNPASRFSPIPTLPAPARLRHPLTPPPPSPAPTPCAARWAKFAVRRLARRLVNQRRS